MSPVIARLHALRCAEAKELAIDMRLPVEHVYGELVAGEAVGLARVEISRLGRSDEVRYWRAATKRVEPSC